MNQSNSRSLERDCTSVTPGSGPAVGTKTTPYHAEFEQKLIDLGVYPDQYRIKHAIMPSKPNNANEIFHMLSQPRRSLSSSQFSESTFQDFQYANRRATTESDAMADVIRTIPGIKDKQFETAGNVVFNNLEKFDPDLSIPKPDKYYGAQTSQIDKRVRDDLGKYIIPSTATNRPAAPNFFLECKGESGRGKVALRQAMYYGAHGARGMLHLQNYGNPQLEYDGNAYTLTSTYEDGHLQIYATHPTRSSGGGTEFYMTLLESYAMTGTVNGFRQGATAYRNSRDWTQKQRDRFIADANTTAQNTSEDGLAQGHVTTEGRTPGSSNKVVQALTACTTI